MHLPHPCPVALSQLKSKDGQAFFCKGCQKHLIDCRAKSQAEIEAIEDPHFCGIFNEDQLEAPARYKGWNRFAFALLTGISLLGFSVKPLQAQTVDPVQVDSIQTKNEQHHQVTVYSVSDVPEPEEQVKKSWFHWFNPRKRNGKRRSKHWMGCPAF
ncbi:hypothetical protein KFE98_16980 [bacterium SCSIO 12741]|nr:hypothetical protein KFE98_16980 [bacterium SCSIO 12741]